MNQSELEAIASACSRFQTGGKTCENKLQIRLFTTPLFSQIVVAASELER